MSADAESPLAGGTGRDFPPIYYAIIRVIDGFSNITGQLISLTMLFLVAVDHLRGGRALFLQRADRLGLRVRATWRTARPSCSAAPTRCYKGAHVRTDIFWDNYSERTKGIIDLISYLVLFFPAMITMMAISIDDAMHSYEIGERSQESLWRAIMWPFRAVIPLVGAAVHDPGHLRSAQVHLPDPLRPRVRASGETRSMTGLEFLGMVMLLVMLAAIFIGLPISFTLLFLALIFGYFGLGVRVFNLAYLQTFGLMKQDEFVAVPMFILMGYVCDQAGLMERLFKAFRDLFAPVRGALYVVVIVTATLFGIAAGTVGATVALLGIMAGPMMIRAGYDVRMSAGAIAAGGTLGILIPPSVMLVVMAPVLDISIIDLYAAAFGPGFLLSGMYIVYTLGRSYWNPKLGPPVPMEERPDSMQGRALGMPRRPRSGHRADHHDARRHSRRPDDRIRGRGARRARRHPARHRLRQVHLEGPARTPATTRSRPPAWCCSSRSRPTCSARCSPGSARRRGSPTCCWRRRCRLGAR